MARCRRRMRRLSHIDGNRRPQISVRPSTMTPVVSKAPLLTTYSTPRLGMPNISRVCRPRNIVGFIREPAIISSLATVFLARDGAARAANSKTDLNRG